MVSTASTASPILLSTGRAQDRGGERLFWGIVDATLLVLVMAVASDMFINLKPIQPLVWLACYGLVMIRITLNFPTLLPVALRNGAVLAYPLVALLSAAWSYAPGASFYAAFQLMVTVLIGAYLGWRYSLGILLKCFAVLLTIAAALSILHGATGIFPWPTHTGAGGLAGVFQHKNMLGLRALFASTIIVGLLLLYRHETGWTPRPILFLAFALCGSGVVLSLSATALLLLPVMAGGVLLLCLRRVHGVLAIAGLAVLVLSLSFGPVALAAAGIAPVETVLSALGKDATLTGRTLLWDIALGVQADHPVLGVGFRAFWLAPDFATGRAMTHAAGAREALAFHNFLLDVVVSLGWPGLLAMIAWLGSAVLRLGRLYRHDRRPMAAVGLMLVVGIVIVALLTTTLTRGHELSILLMAMLTVAAGEDLRRA